MDRNTNPGSTSLTFPGSLSARRAWIEIAQDRRVSGRALVALRKESVDRNMSVFDVLAVSAVVALRKESVDRN